MAFNFPRVQPRNIARWKPVSSGKVSVTVLQSMDHSLGLYAWTTGDHGCWRMELLGRWQLDIYLSRTKILVCEKQPVSKTMWCWTLIKKEDYTYTFKFEWMICLNWNLQGKMWVIFFDGGCPVRNINDISGVNLWKWLGGPGLTDLANLPTPIFFSSDFGNFILKIQ